MKKNIIGDLKLNLIITITIGILNFVLNKYFAEYMGIDTLGLMKLFTQMVAYLNLADLGIAGASSFALYKPLKEKDEIKINIIISTISLFYRRIALVILIVGGVLSFIIPYFIEIENNNKIYIYWGLYVINTSLSYMYAKYYTLFTANQEYGFARKIQGLGRIFTQLIQVFVLVQTKSFSLYILVMVFENFLNYYFYKKHYKKSYYYIKKVKERDNVIVKNMKDLFWHKIGGLVVYNTDYIILSKFVSLKIVGIYSSYLIICQILSTLINILTSVLVPKIGIFIVTNSKNETYKLWREIYSIYMFITTVFLICTYYLILPFINLWLGKEFILSKIAILLILTNMFVNLSRGATDIFKESSGFFEDTYLPGLEAGLNLLVSLILVTKIGLNGVLIGTVVSNITVILFIRPILVFKKCFNKTGVDYILNFSKLFFLFVISVLNIFLIQSKIFKNLLEIKSWFDFIFKGGNFTLIVIVCTLLVFMLDKSFRVFCLKKLKLENKW